MPTFGMVSNQRWAFTWHQVKVVAHFIFIMYTWGLLDYKL